MEDTSQATVEEVQVFFMLLLENVEDFKQKFQ